MCVMDICVTITIENSFLHLFSSPQAKDLMFQIKIERHRAGDKTFRALNVLTNTVWIIPYL